MSTTTITTKLMVFKRFERVWHWSQMALIFTLVFSGFRVHGTHNLISFKDAVNLHTWAETGKRLFW